MAYPWQSDLDWWLLGIAIGVTLAEDAPCPDAERIVFSSDRSGPWRIWIMGADGSEMKQLTKGGDEAHDVDPTFSPDGKQLLTMDRLFNHVWDPMKGKHLATRGRINHRLDARERIKDKLGAAVFSRSGKYALTYEWYERPHPILFIWKRREVPGK